MAEGILNLGKWSSSDAGMRMEGRDNLLQPRWMVGDNTVHPKPREFYQLRFVIHGPGNNRVDAPPVTGRDNLRDFATEINP
jgi:hypothetical protein